MSNLVDIMDDPRAMTRPKDKKKQQSSIAALINTPSSGTPSPSAEPVQESTPRRRRPSPRTSTKASRPSPSEADGKMQHTRANSGLSESEGSYGRPQAGSSRRRS